MHGREEALGHRIVVALARGAGRGTHPHLPAALAERHRGVLRALVRMMDHLLGPALADGHVQRFEDQFGAKVVVHRPTHDAPAVHVEHHGQEHEPRPGRHVGDVGDPEPVRRLGVEVSFDQVRRRPLARLRARGARTPAPAHPCQPFLAHPPRHALAAHRVPPSGQVGTDPRRPVGPSRTPMSRPDLAPQLLIAPRMARTPPASPRLSHPLGETPGTSWPPDARLGSLSRARRPPGHRPGLPSEPSRGFAVKFPTRGTQGHHPRNPLLSAGSVVSAVHAGGKSAYGLPRVVRRFATPKEPEWSGASPLRKSKRQVHGTTSVRPPEAATISCLRGGQATDHESFFRISRSSRSWRFSRRSRRNSSRSTLVRPSSRRPASRSA